MLRLYIEGTFCWYIYRLRYEISDFYTSPFYNRWWNSWRRRCVLGKVLSGQRQTEIQSQSQVIDGRWRSGRRVWRCPWGSKFSEKPGQSRLFFWPIRNHKDMHLDSGLEWYWRGLTWMTVDYCCVPPSLPAQHIRTLQCDEENFETFIIWSLNWEE